EIKSATARSSAKWTGCMSVARTTEILMSIRVVRPPTAPAMTIGDGRYPSLVLWCSDSSTVEKPSLSAQADMSNAAAYSSEVGGPQLGDRMLNAIANSTTPHGSGHRSDRAEGEV